MVPSNHSNFQYCDSNIGLSLLPLVKLSLFANTPCKSSNPTFLRKSPSPLLWEGFPPLNQANKVIILEIEIPRGRIGLNYYLNLYEPNGLFD